MNSSAFSALVDALMGIRRVVTAEHQLDVAPEALEVHDGAAFWAPAAPDTVRVWEASPALVAERRLRRHPEIREMDLMAAWSIGNVLRDLWPALAVKDAVTRYQVTAEAGIRLSGRAYRTAQPGAFVHRIDRRALVEPYRLSLDWGGALPERAIVALGQSRHLGCGLLLPWDRPRDREERA